MQTVKRLIDQFIPEHYDLSLTLARAKRTFSSTVTLIGSLTPSSTGISLHAKDLTITSVTVDGKEASFEHVDDELNITHDDLSPGKHIVVVVSHGEITDTMHGLYPCYFEHEGIKKELLATQFESHHAREVFPCIDEPLAKATFDVTLTTEENVTVLGNMPVIQQTHENGQLVTTFQTTPRMSTYLLAWVVGELHKKTATTNRDIEVSIWATPAQPVESLDFALDIAVRSIEFYEKYFDTEYPLPKSDHVALPDFSSGAMENWGLITYRESALLAHPKTTSITSRQFIATVIAHELAHQWFGNLVTMKWWNNLWLNESFATLMEYLAIDSLHPEWNIWLDFSMQENIPSLRRDSIDGVQSVQIDVHHPDEIRTLFDGAIVYAKGARLLRMLQHYVGNDAFQSGLKQYFKKHAYKNTEGNDLWSAIGQASGKDILSLMNQWISQPGYPVLHVTEDANTISLSQEQFFVGPHEEAQRIWPIPLNASDEALPPLFTDKNGEFTRSSDKTLRFNVEDSAHFITHYDDSLLDTIIRDLEAGALTVIDRVQILNEATLLARGGVIASADLIDLIAAYKNETNEQVWGIVSIALSELRQFVYDDKPAEQKLRAFTASMARSQYERLGWNSQENENEEDTKLRATIISMMLYGEDQDAIDTAKKLYENNDLNDLDPELRPLIISSVVRYGDAEIVDTLLAAYVSSSSSDLRHDICSGITSTRNPEKIAHLLDSIKDSSIVRPQDAARWYVYLVRGRESREKSWQWIRDNWQWVIDTFGGAMDYDYYPRYSASALSSQKQLKEFNDFFMPMKDIPALTRAITMGSSEIQGRIELIERDGEAVRTALLNL